MGCQRAGCCATCGNVEIKQATKPTTCKVKLRTGIRSERLCGHSLTGQKVASTSAQESNAAGLQQRDPHELTLQQFAAAATVTQLVNHGRKWDVVFGGRLSAFSDAATE